MPNTMRALFSCLFSILAAFPAAATAADPIPEKPAPFPGAKLQNGAPAFLIHVGVKDYKTGVFHEDDTLTAVCQSERDAYLYLLYHQADGSTVLIYPNVTSPKNPVRARAVLAIPGPDGKQARIRIRAPFGREVLQVIASAGPIDEFDGLDIKQPRFPAVSAELIDRAAARLAKAPAQWAEHNLPIETLAKAERPAARPAARVGLFIGIGKYKEKDERVVKPAEELRNSAVVLHKAMLERGGLDPERTRLVVDEQATRANLEELIVRWLPSVSRPGDTVFLYFSGHAGQVPDLNDIKPNEMHEMLGPYDLEGRRFRETGILDITLARWLEALEGRQVVLILDTCHAAGVVRDKGIAKMFVSKAARLRDIAQLNTVILTSTASDEQALFDGTPDKTMWFTHFLVQAVRERPAPLTVQEAYEFTRAGMKALFKARKKPASQEPTLTDHALIPIKLVP